jgi:hypothetical protein
MSIKSSRPLQPRLSRTSRIVLQVHHLWADEELTSSAAATRIPPRATAARITIARHDGANSATRLEPAANLRGATCAVAGDSSMMNLATRPVSCSA